MCVYAIADIAPASITHILPINIGALFLYMVCWYITHYIAIGITQYIDLASGIVQRPHLLQVFIIYFIQPIDLFLCLLDGTTNNPADISVGLSLCLFVIFRCAVSK